MATVQAVIDERVRAYGSNPNCWPVEAFRVGARRLGEEHLTPQRLAKAARRARAYVSRKLTKDEGEKMATSTPSRGDNKVEVFAIAEEDARQLLAGLHYGRALDPVKFTHERLTKTMNDLSFLTDSDAGELDDKQTRIFRALTGVLAGRGQVVVSREDDVDDELEEDESASARADDYDVEAEEPADGEAVSDSVEEETAPAPEAGSSPKKEAVTVSDTAWHVTYNSLAKSTAQAHLAEAMTRMAQAQTEMAQALRVMAAEERAEVTGSAETVAGPAVHGRRSKDDGEPAQEKPRRRGRPRKTEARTALAVEKTAEESSATEKPKRAAKVQRTRGGRADATVLDEAHEVLKEAGKALDRKTLAKRIIKRGAWKTNNQTPWITVSGLINKDMKAKGGRSRFRSPERGVFALR